MPLLTLNGSMSFLQRLDAYIQLMATISDAAAKAKNFLSLLI